jgi:hypothetical protein
VREGRAADGRPFVEAAQPAIRGLTYLEPGSTVTFAFDAGPGAISGLSSETDAGFLL